MSGSVTTPQEQPITDSKPFPTDDHDKSHKGFSKEDKISFIILIILYTIQTFFARTIPILFNEKGAHIADLAALSLVTLPFTLKVLLAPFTDTYFFQSFGKRKTYIIPMQYLFVGVCFILSTNLQEEIDQLQVTPVLFYGVLSNTIMAIQDIAVDGWAITIMSPKNIAYGSLAQTIGLLIGGVLAFNIFIPLNSLHFCNSYIFSLPREETLLTIKSFWAITGIVTLVITLLVHFFKEEKPTSGEEISSVWDVVKTLRSFVQNPNLRQLVMVIITGSVTTAPIYALADTILLNKGFSKEGLTTISTLLLPVQFIVPIFVSKLCKRKLEMKVKLWSSFLSYFNSAFGFWIVMNFDKESNYDLTFSLLVISSILQITFGMGNFIANGAYASRICDETISGTFLTTFAALTNLSFQWTRSLSLLINESVPWKYMGIYSIITTPIYMVWSRKNLNELHQKVPEDFRVTSAKKND